MVTDRETNYVYFSQLLSSDSRFKETYQRVSALLDKHQVQHGLLQDTNDIWCRDYMPIQKEDAAFIQFRYKPSYLISDLNLQSDPKTVLASNGVKAIYSDINLDGGNVLRWSDRVIVTDRVFQENPQYTDKLKLIQELEMLFEAEVIVIPAIKSDMTGHADGLVRFYDKTTLIGNRLKDEYQYWQKGMKKVIADYRFDYIELPFFEHKESRSAFSAIGCYVNYLEVGDLVVVPVFEVAGNKDEEVIDILRKVFSDRRVDTININKIAKYGGLLNCTTWNIKASDHNNLCQ